MNTTQPNLLKCILQLADGGLFLSVLQGMKNLSRQCHQTTQSAFAEEKSTVEQINAGVQVRLQAIQAHYGPILAQHKQRLHEALSPFATARDEAIQAAASAFEAIDTPLQAALGEQLAELERAETQEVSDIESTRDHMRDLLRLMKCQNEMAISEARDADLRLAHDRKWRGAQAARTTYESAIREATNAQRAAERAARDRYDKDTGEIRQAHQPEIDRIDKQRQSEISQVHAEATESRDQAQRRRYRLVFDAQTAFENQVKEIAKALTQLSDSRLQALALAHPLG